MTWARTCTAILGFFENAPCRPNEKLCPVSLYWLPQLLHSRARNVPLYERFSNVKLIEMFRFASRWARHTQWEWHVPSGRVRCTGRCVHVYYTSRNIIQTYNWDGLTTMDGMWNQIIHETCHDCSTYPWLLQGRTPYLQCSCAETLPISIELLMSMWIPTAHELRNMQYEWNPRAIQAAMCGVLRVFTLQVGSEQGRLLYIYLYETCACTRGPCGIPEGDPSCKLHNTTAKHLTGNERHKHERTSG